MERRLGHQMNYLPLEERAEIDYDDPHAIDLELLERNIRDHASGKAIRCPICDFAQPAVKDRFQRILASVSASETATYATSSSLCAVAILNSRLSSPASSQFHDAGTLEPHAT